MGTGRRPRSARWSRCWQFPEPRLPGPPGNAAVPSMETRVPQRQMSAPRPASPLGLQCGPMKSHTLSLTMHTQQPQELVRITDTVARVAKESGIQEGMVLVSAMHITAAVFINDDEPGLHEDIFRWLDRLAPKGDYLHHRTGEDNGHAHLRNLLLGHQVLVPVTRGKLDVGPWQQVFYAEFDGQRDKRLLFKAMGE